MPSRPHTGTRSRRWHVARRVLTSVNGTTAAGLLLARLSGATLRPGRDGVLIAEGYKLRIPRNTCFTVGSVILTRRTADWLLAERQSRLLAHECRHASQYAVLGPLFWPAYWLACGWSIALTRSYGVRNFFEKNAGLLDGGYPESIPLRPWAQKALARRTLAQKSPRRR